MRDFTKTLVAGFYALSLSFLILLNSAPLASAQETANAPALWKVSKGDHALYLFGTFHVLPNGTQWRHSELDLALSMSDSLWLEADTEDQQAALAYVEAHAFAPADKTLWDYFSLDEAEYIEVSLAQIGYPSALLTPFRPWFASIQLGVTVLMSYGYSPENGVEANLRYEFVNAGKEIHFLETPEESLNSFTGLSDDVQAKLFIATLKDVQTLEQDIETMLNAWLTGDVEKVVELMGQNSSEIPELDEAVLYKRNENWMPKIKALLEQDGTAFVAVGAAHLVGDRSVIDHLISEGYLVERQ
ncbi:MAG: TraB/GumN family protein [Alphaproteobacteria bacterium]|nr:MAG: TraB/GumN family protein [Alphaproteobacteria bacterium]